MGVRLIFQLNQEVLMTWGIRLAVVLLCLPIHEFAHGYAAYKLGDTTAARQGRLTLNPIRHLDPLGSAVLLLAGFGWAKPVPVDTRVFRNPRRDMAIVAAAGPLANIIMATVMMCIAKIIMHTFSMGTPLHSQGLVWIIEQMLIINLVLAVFNLLPIPPLDGSKLFGAVLPERAYFGMMRYERVVMILLFVLVFTGRLTGVIFTLSRHMFAALDFLTSPIDILMRALVG